MEVPATISDEIALGTPAVTAEMLRNLPPDVRWYMARAGEADLETFRFIYHPSWEALSGGTGRLDEAARRIASPDGVPAEWTVQAEGIRRLSRAFDFQQCGALIVGRTIWTRAPSSFSTATIGPAHWR